MLSIKFDIDTAAFYDDSAERPDDWFFKAMEIRRILDKIGTEIENGSSQGAIFDINGNKGGNYTME